MTFQYKFGNWHCGELFPRVGFIVTTLEGDGRAVVRFYNKRGTAEQWIREGKQGRRLGLPKRIDTCRPKGT